MNPTNPSGRRRPVRSYVIRGGRLTTGQQRALDELYPRWGVPEGDAPLDFDALFGRQKEAFQVGGFPVFVLFLIVNEGLIAFCVRLVRK